MYFLYILIALVFVLTLAALAPVSAEINYEYINKVQKLGIIIRIFKVIKIKIPVNLNKKEKNPESKSKKESEKEKFSFKKAKKLFYDIKNALSDSKSDIFEILAALKKHITINRVFWEMEYGLSDAAKTGMANGAMWAAASGVLSAVDNLSEIKSAELNIYPVFDRECFNLRFKGILTIKTAHIISVGIKILRIINYFAKNLSNK